MLLRRFVTGHGAGSQWGDLNSVYTKYSFRIDPTLPPYQFIIVGDFPNARYFSMDINDNHSQLVRVSRISTSRP